MTSSTTIPEDELRAEYAEQSKAFAHAQQAGKCAAWVMDAEKREVKWMAGGFELFGMPFSHFAGRIQPIDLVEPEDRAAILEVLNRTMETGAPFIVEFRLRWPNGELHWQEARGQLDPDSPNIIRGTTFDITERKNAELGLLRIEKLAAVGRIASTIAHEINNPLASVTNLLYLALLDPALAEPVRGYLLVAEEELARLANVTRLTLSYARPHGAPREVDPLEVIQAVLSLLRRRIAAKEMQVIVVHEEPFHLFLFADELQRIVTNLIANGIDAVRVSEGILRMVLERQGDEALLAVGVVLKFDRVDEAVRAIQMMGVKFGREPGQDLGPVLPRRQASGSGQVVESDGDHWMRRERNGIRGLRGLRLDSRVGFVRRLGLRRRAQCERDHGWQDQRKTDAPHGEPSGLSVPTAVVPCSRALVEYGVSPSAPEG